MSGSWGVKKNQIEPEATSNAPASQQLSQPDSPDESVSPPQTSSTILKHYQKAELKLVVEELISEWLDPKDAEHQPATGSNILREIKVQLEASKAQFDLIKQSDDVVKRNNEQAEKLINELTYLMSQASLTISNLESVNTNVLKTLESIADVDVKSSVTKVALERTNEVATLNKRCLARLNTRASMKRVDLELTLERCDEEIEKLANALKKAGVLVAHTEGHHEEGGNEIDGWDGNSPATSMLDTVGTFVNDPIKLHCIFCYLCAAAAFGFTIYAVSKLG